MEDFNDQPNGICSECWDKTLIFDQFYKSVQAAHLLLLNSKYKSNELENVDIKCENIATEDILLTDDLIVEDTAYDYGTDHEEDQNAIEQKYKKGKQIINKLLK